MSPPCQASSFAPCAGGHLPFLTPQSSGGAQFCGREAVQGRLGVLVHGSLGQASCQSVHRAAAPAAIPAGGCIRRKARAGMGSCKSSPQDAAARYLQPGRHGEQNIGAVGYKYSQHHEFLQGADARRAALYSSVALHAHGIVALVAEKHREAHRDPSPASRSARANQGRSSRDRARGRLAVWRHLARPPGRAGSLPLIAAAACGGPALRHPRHRPNHVPARCCPPPRPAALRSPKLSARRIPPGLTPPQRASGC